MGNPVGMKGKACRGNANATVKFCIDLTSLTPEDTRRSDADAIFSKNLHPIFGLACLRDMDGDNRRAFEVQTKGI
ncbi:hypothetical protein [Sulfitobacter dubius]|jgi:hypothetical protein|uniref:hypothetical protein n=1 Tax=Sulfitobacter dubius TaxID=218673 RepID=UPI0014288DD1|nr:hypothetical protein [Sulfitobacter dubius]